MGRDTTWDKVGSSFSSGIQFKDAEQGLLDNMHKYSFSGIDSIFKDKRSLDEKNDANLKDRNTTDIEMRLASGELALSDLAGLTGSYVDGDRISKFADKMMSQSHNASLIEQQKADRKQRLAIADNKYALDSAKLALDYQGVQDEKDRDLEKAILLAGNRKDTLAIQKATSDSVVNTNAYNLKQQQSKDTRKKNATNNAAEFSRLDFPEQDIALNTGILNGRTLAPEQLVDMMTRVEQNKKLYRSLNNNSSFSEANQGVAANMVKLGLNPSDVIPTIEDTSLLTTYNAIKNSNPKKALGIARQIDPGVDTVINAVQLKSKSDKLLKTIKYSPDIPTQLATGLSIGLSTLGSMFSLQSPNTARIENEVLKLKRIYAELPDGESKVEAEGIIKEYEDLLKRKSSGNNVVSQELIDYRLRRSLPGASRRRNSGIKNVNKELKKAGKTKSTKSVADSITK